MVLVAGAVFAFLRGLFALFPSLALRQPIKKWAAAGALVVAAVYLALSGGSIPTQRSFIMLAVVLVAVLLDRRAFSIRNVAVAAAIVLILKPEAIVTVSFQMSFAATLALIAGFEAVADRRRERLLIAARSDRGPVALLCEAGSFSPDPADLTTAPTTFHFNRTQPLSLIANLAAMRSCR
jgi:competence protein ComEC